MFSILAVNRVLSHLSHQWCHETSWVYTRGGIWVTSRSGCPLWALRVSLCFHCIKQYTEQQSTTRCVHTNYSRPVKPNSTLAPRCSSVASVYVRECRWAKEMQQSYPSPAAAKWKVLPRQHRKWVSQVDYVNYICSVHLPPSYNTTLKKKHCPQSLYPYCGVSGAHQVGMKEALSKSVILERLVSASRLKAGNAEHPLAPCLW